MRNCEADSVWTALELLDGDRDISLEDDSEDETSFEDSDLELGLDGLAEISFSTKIAEPIDPSKYESVRAMQR